MVILLYKYNLLLLLSHIWNFFYIYFNSPQILIAWTTTFPTLLVQNPFYFLYTGKLYHIYWYGSHLSIVVQMTSFTWNISCQNVVVKMSTASKFSKSHDARSFNSLSVLLPFELTLRVGTLGLSCKHFLVHIEYLYRRCNLPWRCNCISAILHIVGPP